MNLALLAAALLGATTSTVPVATELTGGRGRVLVDFVSDEPSERWFASAIEQQLLQELARFQRVMLVETPDVSTTCPPGSVSCLLEAHTGVADVIVLGTLRGSQLDFEVHETLTRSVALDGSLDVGRRVSGGTLQHQLGRIVRTIVQSGGLLDQLPVAQPEPSAPPVPTKEDARQPSASTPATPTPPIPPVESVAPTPLNAWLLLLWALLSAAPLGLGLWLAGGAALRRGRAAWLPSLGLSALIFALLFASLLPGVRAHLAAAPGLLVHPVAGLVLNIVGGTLWAAFVLLNLSFVVPPLAGVGRASPGVLGSLLRAWSAMVLMRVSALVLYLPLGALVLTSGRALAVSERVLWILLLPSAGLLLCCWLLSMVAVLSMKLDTQLVEGAATAHNRGHAALRRYVRGYLRRSGVDLGAELLSHILFLPGKSDGVFSYGGGLFATPRIVVSERLLELAIGPLPEERELAESAVFPQALEQGLVLPSVSARVAQKGADSPRRAERQQRLRSGMARVAAFEKSPMPRLLGEAATLLGWVMPSPRDETVPLISNTREDYEVVHSLLTEHYAAFETDGTDEDDDDTDPTQRDFLYGALLREIGAVRRHGCLITTVRLAFAERSRKVGWLVTWTERFSDLLDRFLSRWPAVVADAYAALHFGRDHLIQYYALRRRPGSDASLTVRADSPALLRASRDVLEGLSQDAPSGLDLHLFRATERNRLVSLSRFFHTPVEEPRGREVRRVAALVTAGAFTVVLLVSLIGAFGYHPVYLERMRERQAHAAEAQRGGADGGSP